MRFIQGDTFKEAIDRFHQADVPGRESGERSLALRKLLSQFVTVCNAVAYAHSRGVINRDIKDNNIMLGKFGETLVIDWGLAKQIGTRGDGPGTSEEPAGTLAPVPSSLGPALTEMGTVLGTPAYMSPEAAAGRLDLLSPASDIYSLGALLYKVLTDRPPIEGQDRNVVLRKASRGEWLPARQVKKDVPAALDAICRKAMAIMPEARYGAALELAADVEHWLADEPVPVHREGWMTRLGRWSRRHKALVSAAGALLLTAVLGLGIGLAVVQQEKGRTQQALVAESQRRQQARAALDAMSSQIINEWLGKQKELLPEHKAFLEAALASYEEFAQDTRQDEESRAGVAAASRRVGDIYRKLGQAAEAEAPYRRSAELYVLLAADFPDQPDLRSTLARTHNNLGNLLAETGRLQEAETAYRDALALLKPLTADFPSRPDFRSELANSHNDLGTLLHRAGRLQEAETAYRDALGVRKQLAADFPNQPDFRSDLARSHNDLGALLQTNGRPKEAETAFGEALAVRKQLAADFPNQPDFRYDLANSHNNLGVMLESTGRHQDAVTAFRDALTLYMQLAADFPNRPGFRADLAKSHNNLGILLKEAGRIKEAETAFRDALASLKQLASNFPKVPEYQADLANTLDCLAELAQAQHHHADAFRLLDEAQSAIQQALRTNPRYPFYRAIAADNRNTLAQVRLGLGEHAAAAAAAEEMGTIGANPANDAYSAACLLASCLPLAQKDAKLSVAKRQELARSYADRAMALLRQAVAAGYKDAEHMKKDKDIDPLRGREDFKKMLADVEAKAGSPRK
jgi:serine/threonine-protein kinase